MFSHGLVVGKFYPPHRGHKFLIDTARAQCEALTVLVCYKKTESISEILRIDWLQQIHPDVKVVAIEDKLADDDSEGWAKSTIELLGLVPDAVFTSESYGDAYAGFMGTTHVLVDKERKHVPISGTLVRSNPLKYSEFLEPCVRAYFTRKICVLGAESTGTTTLAEALAKHYQTIWVPEYGRMYSMGKVYSDKKTEWNTSEFVHIAKIQNALETKSAEFANALVICDTDAFATSLWHERYMGTRSKEVEEIASQKKYDLYILTGDEIPFEDDGLRDGEHIRHSMHRRFIGRLREDQKHFILVAGSPAERLDKAICEIDTLVKIKKVY